MMEKSLIDIKEAVRVGDVFADIRGRSVLACRQLPGGRMEVAVYWKDEDGGRTRGPLQGDYRNNELKCLPRLGRAEYYDGFYTTPDALIDLALTFKNSIVKTNETQVLDMQVSPENDTDTSQNNMHKEIRME